MADDEHKVLIIGSGPAGYTAAIYAARAQLNPIMITGTQMGGQLMITSDVENFPGFAEPVLGPELMERMRAQAERFGTKMVQDDVIDVDFSVYPFKVVASGAEHRALSVIVATGSNARWLDIPSETKLRGKGVSACATCDGFFFREKVVVVVGGGDSAMEEACFLTKFASKVYLIHRRHEFRASKAMQERLMGNKKIEVVWDSVVDEILGDRIVEGVKLRNVKTNEASTLRCDGVFMAIGHEPNTSVFKGKLELDEKGYIVPKEHTMTSVPGVFVAGDVCDPRYKQAVTAAGCGCRAAIDAEKWLIENGKM
jgi:thioredoxin reductase (NADPH)